jgi:zinc transport system ATP-binding protein
MDSVKSIVTLQNLCFSYEKDKVLENISFEIPRGSYIALVGPNGVGKSTLLKLICGLKKPNSGTVQIATDKISYLSQLDVDKSIRYPLNVREIVSLGLRNGPFSFMRHEDWVTVDNWLTMFGLNEFEKRKLSELSGGQQQKARLAKCLISEPDLLLLDEPDTGIDEKSREDIRSILRHLNKEHGMTIILVSHRPEEYGEDCTMVALSENALKEVRHDLA